VWICEYVLFAHLMVLSVCIYPKIHFFVWLSEETNIVFNSVSSCLWFDCVCFLFYSLFISSVLLGFVVPWCHAFVLCFVHVNFVPNLLFFWYVGSPWKFASCLFFDWIYVSLHLFVKAVPRLPKTWGVALALINNCTWWNAALSLHLVLRWGTSCPRLCMPCLCLRILGEDA